MIKALELGYIAIPVEILTIIFEFLLPYPDRMSAASVCARWREASSQPCFVIRVLPVESGARDAVAAGTLTLAKNVCTSLNEALTKALPGQTIVLGSGNRTCFLTHLLMSLLHTHKTPLFLMCTAYLLDLLGNVFAHFHTYSHSFLMCSPHLHYPHPHLSTTSLDLNPSLKPPQHP